jgi:hypothetical protein
VNLSIQYFPKVYIILLTWAESFFANLAILTHSRMFELFSLSFTEKNSLGAHLRIPPPIFKLSCPPQLDDMAGVADAVVGDVVARGAVI